MIVGYARISDRNNKSESINNQIDLIKEYCKSNDLKIDKIYIDNGYSGINEDREGLRNLKSDIELGKVTMLIVKDISRIGRDTFNTSYIVNEYLVKYNVTLISLDECYDESFINIKSILNEYYVKSASFSRKSTAIMKTLNKEFIGVYAPFGYKVAIVDNRRTLVINECEASVVRLIFDLRLKGYEIGDVGSYLKRYISSLTAEYTANVRKRTWNYQSLYKTLKNVVYKGDLVVRKSKKDDYHEKVRKYISKRDLEVIPNVFPAIVSEDIFNRVNTCMKSYESHKRIREESYLKDKVFCSNCLSDMRYYQRHKRDKYECYFKCLKCNKTILLSKLNLIVEGEKDKLIKNILKNNVIDMVLRKMRSFIKDKCDSLINKKACIIIQIKELYRKENSSNGLKMAREELNKINYSLKRLESVIIDSYLDDFIFDIDTSLIVKRIEVFNRVKIFYNIKKAY